MTHKYQISSQFVSRVAQYSLVAFCFRKIIAIKPQYKTYNQEFWAIIDNFKTWYHYLKGCNTRSLSLLIITNSNNSWILKASALNKFARYQSSLVTIFASIITMKRPVRWWTPCSTFFREIRPKKKYSEIKILRFFIVYRSHL